MNIFVEFKATDKKGEKTYTFNRDNINYFRNWVSDSGGLSTIIYLKGSDRGVVIPVHSEQVKKQLQNDSELEGAISNMSSTEKKELLNYIKQKEAIV